MEEPKDVVGTRVGCRGPVDGDGQAERIESGKIGNPGQHIPYECPIKGPIPDEAPRAREQLDRVQVAAGERQDSAPGPERVFLAVEPGVQIHLGGDAQLV